MAVDGEKDTLWTPSNIITIIRICLVPVFVVAIITPWPEYFGLWDFDWIKSWVAAAIFVLVAATDGVDGYLARSRGDTTDFGKLFDPLADKILIAAALLALIELGDLPSWVALIILTREFIVSGIRMVAASHGVVIAASWSGKAKTVFQIIAVVMFILKRGMTFDTFSEVIHSPFYLLSWAVMLVALILTIVSLVDYFMKSKELLGFKPPRRRKWREALANTQTTSAEDAGTTCSSDKFVDDSISSTAVEVLDAAERKGVTIGTAESLTGGLISSVLTAVPGSSAVVRGSIVSYATDVKHDVLDVDTSTIEQAGVVSEETALEMATGACKNLECDIAVAVTGIAGPDGGTEETPVGTVYIACVSTLGENPHRVVERYQFSGERNDVRKSTVIAALNLLLEAL